MSLDKTKLRGALIGTLLGDSWITHSKQHNSFKFGCEQTSESLIKLKYEIISYYCEKRKKPIGQIQKRQRSPRIISDGKISVFKPTYRFSVGHPYFKFLYKIFYNTGKKQVTINILKYLTIEGLALWYMDDGYIYYVASNSTRYLDFATDGFDLYSCKNIKMYFKQYHNLECKIIEHKKNKQSKVKYRIRFNAFNAQKLICLIYPYVLEEFKYKLDLKYKHNPKYLTKILPDYVTIMQKEFNLKTVCTNSISEDIVCK